MYFRSNRRHSSTGGSSAVRSASPQAALYYGSAGVGAGVAGVAVRGRTDRPTSAPSQMVVTSRDIAHVEQRLKIVKRNRASAAARRTTDPPFGQGSMERESPAPVPPTSVPPCSAYPVFNMSQLPPEEQSMVDALVAECLDVLVFSSCEPASPPSAADPYWC